MVSDSSIKCPFLLTVFTAATPCLQTQRTTASETSSNIFLLQKSNTLSPDTEDDSFRDLIEHLSPPEKMAGLCWMAVVLAFSLSAGNTEAMNQNRLETIVKYIMEMYSVCNKGNTLQFSLAVNIPENQYLNLQELFKDDVADNVKRLLKKGKVYTSNNMVAAMPMKKKDEHAEARVLANIQPLPDSSAGKSLVFYSYLSPCVTKCANPKHDDNILKDINEKIPKDKWAERVFVFSTIFKKYTDQNGKEQEFSENEIRDALKELGGTTLDYNIFRCDYSYNAQASDHSGPFQCIKCFSNGAPEPVDEHCVQKEFKQKKN
ncbi:uncharacterized protein LOC120565143 [Perca fluviatilis]|uniref:uncharacterized protein LOC120565143 n=1 Tax=Perca fluviatilis TaxID=8168 RepID=UPI0019640224|nr:uncharacterized protein LOC120565143 [Perca fluviatilis]